LPDFLTLNLLNSEGDTDMAQDVFKMSPEEFSDLRAQVAAIGQQDVQLGRVLTALVLHLGHAHGLDPVQEDARLAAEARVKAREEEDAAVKAAEDERVKTRALEDAQPLSPAQVAARDLVRADEDKQLQADADERKRVRAEEDERAKAEADALAGKPAPVEAPVVQEGA
jgi:hypothetical protein